VIYTLTSDYGGFIKKSLTKCPFGTSMSKALDFSVKLNINFKEKQ